MRKNLDEVSLGLENLYNELCSAYGNSFIFDKKKKIFYKLGWLLFLIVFILMIAFGPDGNVEDRFDIGILVIFSFLYLCLPFYNNKKMDISKVENEILTKIKEDIKVYDECSKSQNMMDDYDRSLLYNRNYNIYKFDKRYTYMLDDHRMVEGIHLDVRRKINSKNEEVYFQGQFIKLPNSYKVKSRIDIIKNIKLSSKQNVQLDNILFEKNFEVYCSDREYAYQILTSDVMDLLNEYFKIMGETVTITLVDEDIYIKLPSKLIELYSNAFNNPLKRETVYYFANRFKKTIDFLDSFTNKLDGKKYL